eukprot:870324-Prorocentrum_minimum.AAC.2
MAVAKLVPPSLRSGGGAPQAIADRLAQGRPSYWAPNSVEECATKVLNSRLACPLRPLRAALHCHTRLRCLAQARGYAPRQVRSPTRPLSAIPQSRP